MRHLAGISIVCAAACVSSPERDVTLGTTEQHVETNNGENLNGENLNGENLNGENLNGENLNGSNLASFAIWTSLEDVTIDDVPIDSVTLSATRFSGMRGLVAITNEQFAGAEFITRRADGVNVRYRIDSIVPHENVTGYFLSYLSNGQWLPVCRDAQDVPLEAYPINGTWDHTQGTPTGGSHTDDPDRFTFACRKLGAIAKCVDIGYRPWEHPDHHLACVRMLRADYCRNGTPYTTTGRLINVYDSIGIQIDTDDWGIDGEWDVGGARCFTSHNRASTAVPCYDPAWETSCGDLQHFGSGTLIMNELP